MPREAPAASRQDGKPLIGRSSMPARAHRRFHGCCSRASRLRCRRTRGLSVSALFSGRAASIRMPLRVGRYQDRSRRILSARALRRRCGHARRRSRSETRFSATSFRGTFAARPRFRLEVWRIFRRGMSRDLAPHRWARGDWQLLRGFSPRDQPVPRSDAGRCWITCGVRSRRRQALLRCSQDGRCRCRSPQSGAASSCRRLRLRICFLFSPRSCRNAPGSPRTATCARSLQMSDSRFRKLRCSSYSSHIRHG